MEKLRIYQTAIDLVTEIYSLIRKHKNLSADWSLCDQVKRASISVAANIAERYLRSKNHFKNYLKIASGSANEVVALLQVIQNVHGVNTVGLQESYKILAKQISSFSTRLKSNFN